MLKSLRQMTCFALVAGLAAPLATPLSAQNAAETGAETADQNAVDQGLDLGQPVEEIIQIGQRYAKEKYGDWDLVCIKTESGDDPCNLFQLLKDNSGGPVAEISLFRINQDGGQAVAGATLVAPLETLLSTGVTVSVDGAPGKRYNFNYCSQAGCIAQIGLTDGDIAAFKQGSVATVSVRPATSPNSVVTVNMSLNGFTAGFDAVDVVSQ